MSKRNNSSAKQRYQCLMDYLSSDKKAEARKVEERPNQKRYGQRRYNKF